MWVKSQSGLKTRDIHKTSLLLALFIDPTTLSFNNFLKDISF